jgi:hypothetical protein
MAWRNRTAEARFPATPSAPAAGRCDDGLDRLTASAGRLD